MSPSRFRRNAIALMSLLIAVYCHCSRAFWCPAKMWFSAWAWVSQTLVSDPLSLLNGLWSRTQGHEIALDNVLGVVWVEPQRHGPWEVILFEGIITTGHQAALLIHCYRLRQRGRLGQRWKVGRQAC